MTLSERLKEVRKQHGCTRRQLAADLGRNYATITNYENGEREPGHTYLIEIARQFAVPAEYPPSGRTEHAGAGAAAEKDAGGGQRRRPPPGRSRLFRCPAGAPELAGSGGRGDGK